MSNLMNAAFMDFFTDAAPGIFPFKAVLLLSASGTAAAVGNTGPVLELVGDLVVDIAGLSTETVQIQGSQNRGTTWSAALNPFGDTTENLQANAATLGNGRYLLPIERFGAFDDFRIVKSSTVDTVRAQIIGIVPKMRARGTGGTIPG